MADKPSSKVLVKRPSKVRTDSRGRSVWADPVESANLELVSTQTLKHILAAKDDQDRRAIEKAVQSHDEGVLARNQDNGEFEIIGDEELQAIVDDSSFDLPKLSKPADVTLEPLHDYADDEQLSLVSTQALRRVLLHEDETDDESGDDEGGGFNPYDRN